MPEKSRDVRILRDLAKTVAGIAAKPVQDERRELWRRHNSLIRTRPLIYVRWGACMGEVLPGEKLQCEDRFFRNHERYLRSMICQDRLGDDFIIEPWITVEATRVPASEKGPWGVSHELIRSGEARGAFKQVPALKEPEDIDKLVRPIHEIDDAATARDAARLRDAIGDILEVNVCRAPSYRMWHGDISTDLGYLRGIEQVMWDMSDRPEWLHRLCAFMRDGIMAAHDSAEDAGDWRLADHQNQAMPYSVELADPKANSESVMRNQLWYFVAAQELAQVSPEMHDEFMLQYQIPIAAKFGLVAYGCCEDLTRKIKYLRRIPNLRRIAVTPWADVAKCAEQIQEDYVFSWRPSPAEMICNGFNPEKVRRITRQAMEESRGCHVDITLKDIETIGGNFDNLVEWTSIVRQITDEYA